MVWMEEEAAARGRSGHGCWQGGRGREVAKLRERLWGFVEEEAGDVRMWCGNGRRVVAKRRGLRWRVCGGSGRGCCGCGADGVYVLRTMYRRWKVQVSSLIRRRGVTVGDGGWASQRLVAVTGQRVSEARKWGGRMAASTEACVKRRHRVRMAGAWHTRMVTTAVEGGPRSRLRMHRGVTDGWRGRGTRVACAVARGAMAVLSD